MSIVAQKLDNMTYVKYNIVYGSFAHCSFNINPRYTIYEYVEKQALAQHF
jgi:hypothetical protein